MLHEHAAPIAELHRQGDASSRAQPVDILAALLPGWNVCGASIASQDLSFFKMNMNGMVPAAAGIHQGPYFTRTEARRRGDTAKVRIQPDAAVGAYSPRTAPGGDGV